MKACALYVLGRYPLWSETFLRQDLALLMECGVPIVPIALFSGNTPMQRDWPRVRALFPATDTGQSDFSPDRRIPSALRSFYTELALHRHRYLVSRLADYAREKAVTHIHAEFGDLPALIAARVAKDLRLSYSVGLHAKDVWTPKYSERWLYDQATFLTVCNDAARKQLLCRHASLAGRTYLVPHGIDLRQWPFDPERGPARETFRLLFVGRFVPKKGIMTLIDAMAELSKNGIDAHLTLVGSGPQAQAIEEKIHAMGLPNSVTFAGVLKRSEVQNQMLQSDALIVPSETDPTGDQDGLPNVVLEAMALGLPVGGTQAGSLGEALTDETGEIFSTSDPAGCARAIMQMKSNWEDVDRKRRNARRHIENSYDAVKLAQDRSALFGQVLQKNGKE